MSSDFETSDLIKESKEVAVSILKMRPGPLPVDDGTVADAAQMIRNLGGRWHPNDISTTPPNPGDRQACCDDWPKPCPYHEGYQEGHEQATRNQWSDDDVLGLVELIEEHVDSPDNDARFTRVADRLDRDGLRARVKDPSDPTWIETDRTCPRCGEANLLDGHGPELHCPACTETTPRQDGGA